MRELSAEHRALVELSVVRGVSDHEIAGYLGIDAEEVRERRDAALHTVAAGAGDGSADGRQMVIEHLRGAPAVDAGSEPDAEASAEPDAEARTGARADADTEDRPGTTIVGPALVAVLFVIFTIALVVALRGKNDSAPVGSDSAAAPAQSDPSTTKGAQARLEPLAGGGATGTASIVPRGGGASLKLSVRGLPRPATGGYVVWLYDSVSDARSLTSSLKGRFQASTPLPAGYERYRYLDVSREPADGNRNHSGESVLRVPLSALK